MLTSQPAKRVCESAKPACKTVIPAPWTDARENRVLSSPVDTLLCFLSRHPRGVYHSGIHSIIPSTPGVVLGARERDNLSGSQNKEGSMSSSGLDWERKCGAPGEGKSRKRRCRGRANVRDVQSERKERDNSFLVSQLQH